jgi:hypothetical protein
MKSKSLAGALLGMLVLSLLSVTIATNGQTSATVTSITEKVIYAFTGKNGDGIQPSTPLTGTLNSNGKFVNLYGATSVGGASDGACASGGCGTVFALTRVAGEGWSETVPVSFEQTNGAVPSGGLLAAPSASSAVGPTLFGTAIFGGTASDPSTQFSGNGTIFSLTGNALTTLWYFSGNADETSPSGSLIFDPAAGVPGAVYGTTRGGHSPLQGTVFSVQDKTGSLSTIWTFSITDGKRPLGGLVADKRGVLYGTTYEGAANSVGGVFKLTPPASAGGSWTEQTLYSFTGTTDGGNPEQPDSLIMDKWGALYGTAFTGGSTNDFCGATGCGVVYKLVPPASAGGSCTEHVLWTLTGGNDGAYPLGGVIMDASGALYGTTNGSGLLTNKFCNDYEAFDTGCGVAYKLTPPSTPGGAWTETTLWVFGNTDTDGTNPIGDLLPNGTGALFGAAAQGGSTKAPCKKGGCGAIFKLTGTGFNTGN